MKISTILDQIDEGAFALPVFQRGYVWNREQVRGLMESLYRRHPVGSLLTWVTRTENATSRGDSPLQPGYVKLLLDGQQRITTLYGIIRGKEPPFFEGNLDTFTGLHFNMETETVLNQDLAAIEDAHEGLDRLLEGVRRQRGDLRVSSNDFSGWSKGARFYPLLYLLTRVYHAKDWDTGIELSNHMLGSLSRLELHHIFPKSLLYEHGYERHEVNALANFTFLTQDTNLKVSNRNTAGYIQEFLKKQPHSIESHWIPMDASLWRIENYRAFLEARRELLAQAANQFLDGLLEGSIPESEPVGSVLHKSGPTLGVPQSEDEEQLLLDANLWVIEQGLPEGEFDYELVDEVTGELLASLDLAWPDGLQAGYSQPVALLIDEDQDTRSIASQTGFRFYTDVESLKQYVRDGILALSLVAN